MGKLKSSYSNISNYVQNKPSSMTEVQAVQTAIQNNVGKNIVEITTLKDIAKYIEYTELKSSTFKPSSSNAAVYKDGQVVKLTFEFVK